MLLEQWSRRRAEWQRAELPARKAAGLFDRLFELRGRLKREGERVLLVIADGVLRGTGSSGPVLHPIFTQRAELVFDPQEPSFTVLVGDEPPELNTALLRTIDKLDARALGELRERFKSDGVDILDAAAVGATLAEYLNTLFPNAEVLDSPTAQGKPDHIQAWHQRLLLLTPRTARIADAVDSIIRRIENQGHVPGPIAGIVGLDDDAPPLSAPLTSGGLSSRMPSASSLQGVSDQTEARRAFLLTKPANEAQTRILSDLEAGGGVVVKGPPGTGKTHTIANILGHFLAKGCKTLVVSHTSKALRVLREQMPSELRPLCVSVLDSDSESKRELEESVQGITTRLSSSSKHDLRRRADRLLRERDRLIDELESAEKALRQAVASEYTDIVVNGQGLSPSKAARRVRELEEDSAWIPGIIPCDSPCPLSDDELHELYRLNDLVKPDEEESLSGHLPAIEELPNPSEFDRLLGEEAELGKVDVTVPSDLWRSDSKVDVEALARAQECVRKSLRQVLRLRKQVHLLDCMDAGRRGGPKVLAWRSLVGTIRTRAADIEANEAVAMGRGALVPLELCTEQMKHAAKEIQDALGRTGQIFKLIATASIRLRPDWSKLAKGSTVAQRPPVTVDDFKAVEARIEAATLRDAMVRDWRAAMHDVPDVRDADLGERPEDTIRQHADQIELALNWSEESWAHALSAMSEVGIELPSALRRVEPKAGRFSEFERLIEGAEKYILPVLQRKLHEQRLLVARARFDALVRCLDAIETKDDLSGLARSTAEAVRDRDRDRYAHAHSYLEHLLKQSGRVNRRAELLAKLRPAAADWVRAIEGRTSGHEGPTPPGPTQHAWLCAQLSGALEERSCVSIADAQSLVTDLRDQLRTKTTDLVETSAWASQHERIRHSEMQALEGWLSTVSTRGYESGKRSTQLKLQARRLLMQARGAVPVWIMTTNRAIDSLDFSDTAFDVVIIDEASQSNIMGLLPMSLAESAIVVGDDKQVSPISWENLEETQKLIDEHLQGLPTRELFTGRFSIYDFASQSFKGRHLLTEHFRCAGEIIEFSNQLSYEGRIQPLRDCSAVTRRPPVIEHRVQGLSERKTNQIEVEEIASLLIACLDQPEYSGASFGVITMLGEEQAIAIDQVLRLHVSESRYESARILCGSPPQFQGDERDVIFLSLVDSSGEGPLRLKRDIDSEKRYNVAASRARDQLWVVHSIDERDLKEGDLRLRLIRHARDAGAASRQVAQINRHADSDFERRVGKDLTDRGYRVVPQWPVGSLKIDLVVLGPDGLKAAVECDGDSYHGLDRLDDDLARQQVLERLGWRFVRIRGSQYFRAPASSIADVIRRLDDIGVTPIGAADDNVPVSQSGDQLLDRIRRRASELRQEWKALDELDEEPDLVDAPDDEMSVGLEEAHATPFAFVEGSASVHGSSQWVESPREEEELIECIREADRPVARQEILERTSIDPQRWTRLITKLIGDGRVIRMGEKRGARYIMAPSLQPDEASDEMS
ncbi:MAG: AAA family ATPase [Phycisphaerales bacterium]|nr:AAA family ATPase [Phycisphaerales bacterium]